MKNFGKNVLLLIVVLILSYLTAPYFGSWYDKFSPQYGGGMFGNFSKELAIMIAGIPVAYVFFITFLFTLLGSGRRNWWTSILLLPAALLWISADKYYIYIPIVLALIAWGLAALLRKLFHRNNTTG